MGLHLASCGAGVSLARSVISDGAVVPSHPGRCTDGLMCGEMSREQSFSPSLSSPLGRSQCVSTSSCFLFTSSCSPLPSFSFSSPSLHLLYLSLSPLFPFMHLPPSIPFFSQPASLFPPSVFTPSSPRGDCVLGLQSLESVQRQ